jgi:hypothetical protein
MHTIEYTNEDTIGTDEVTYKTALLYHQNFNDHRDQEVQPIIVTENDTPIPISAVPIIQTPACAAAEAIQVLPIPSSLKKYQILFPTNDCIVRTDIA